jgi:hypothetical protein
MAFGIQTLRNIWGGGQQQAAPGGVFGSAMPQRGFADKFQDAAPWLMAGMSRDANTQRELMSGAIGYGAQARKERREEKKEAQIENETSRWLVEKFGLDPVEAQTVARDKNKLNYYLGQSKEKGRLVPIEGGYLYDEDTKEFIASPGAVTRQGAQYPSGVNTPEAQKAYDAEAGKAASEVEVKRQGATAFVQKVDALIQKLKTTKGVDSAFGPMDSSGVGRWAKGVVGADSAAMQQDIEADLRALEIELRKAMKGQGAVSDYDAKVIAQRLGGLSTVDAATQTRILEGLRDQLAAEHGLQIGAGAGAGALPAGVTEDDVLFTMQKHGLTREQVLQQLGGQ